MTREARGPGASSPVCSAPVSRLLARLGPYRRFIDRQRLVNTFVTDLRGPDVRLTFMDSPVTDVIALSMVTGNVTVGFAVLSYAGTLTVTIIVDPDVCPDLDRLASRLQEQLDRLVRQPADPPGIDTSRVLPAPA